MDILDNPFHILRATMRDTRQMLIERAEERSLVEDPEQCTSARAILTHPRKRLAAELRWLPGLSPKRADAAVQVLKRDVSKIGSLDSLPPLARANLYAAALPRVAEKLDRERLVQWIGALARACDEIDTESVLGLLNEERAVAGLQPISDEAAIDQELADLWKHYGDSVNRALNERESGELVEVVTELVDAATEAGSRHAPPLIDDIVDRYELETQRFLESEGQNVRKILDFIAKQAATGSAEPVLLKAVDQLESVLKNWDRVAQPVQVSRLSRGQEHTLSRDLAAEVRGVAVDIFNEHGVLETSQRITEIQQSVFAEVLSAAERAAEDLEQLTQLKEDAKQAEARDHEWRQELEFEAEWGFLTKRRFRFSADGIEWKGNLWPLDEISRVRWGMTKRYVNGIPSGTDYLIVIGTTRALERIQPKDERVFGEITTRLFRGVVTRLVVEMLGDLAKGKKYRFGNAVVDDFGMELETKRFFGGNERHHYTWDQLAIGSGGGYFTVGRRGDKKTSVELSYQDHDNTQVLETAIRMLWQKGGTRMSSIL